VDDQQRALTEDERRFAGGKEPPLLIDPTYQSVADEAKRLLRLIRADAKPPRATSLEYPT
jgi:hypothetical protein